MALFLRDKKDEEKLNKVMQLFKAAKTNEFWGQIADSALYAAVSYFVYDGFSPLKASPDGLVTPIPTANAIPIANTNSYLPFALSYNGIDPNLLKDYAKLFAMFALGIHGVYNSYNSKSGPFSWLFKKLPGSGGSEIDDIITAMTEFAEISNALPKDGKQDHMKAFLKDVMVLFVSCLKNTCAFKHDLEPVHAPQTHTIYNNPVQNSSFETLWKKMEVALKSNAFTETCFNEAAIKTWNNSPILKRLQISF